ncbi:MULTISPECIES: ATP-dependent Clp protease adapter ClpS [Shewanella]|uniref:ATP-dependent Clp protease adapter protein ClpS n=1 Tax=Shewanella piezotolerans (strain WP3 / JCM 13877) TaxID=225849 RepID=CLPS_SHEPW|nr:MULTISPECIES: ATP-dependent Clp protease adapter ClpS [Shewanella]B8CLI1.1 RecName: Full=ATP-dependent Clp protease adapter protein ClpS [Shewanella piezotolerans WP3]ACJ28632.1 ATP-dependent Clp protease adaptor protein ClpS [Shewanella piezotolerans WP3]MCL1094834.1 ATP-dependent Clp protease adapter ClpS [Shewanella kaireitica]GIU05417.1 ATP-dependent Clp protease adapter protein ClpS [Shewanella sp. c952]
MSRTENIEHVEESVESELKQPSMYKVILNNDDYTPMDFVIEILQLFFRKDEAQATEIMLAIHHKGKGICGIYPFGIAETKVAQVNQFARQNEHPLLCSLEEA